MCKLLGDVEAFTATRIDELAKSHLGLDSIQRLIKDFVDPDPDDGGQGRYERERFEKGLDVSNKIREILQDIYKVNYGVEASVTIDPINPNEFHITSKIVNKSILFNMEP